MDHPIEAGSLVAVFDEWVGSPHPCKKRKGGAACGQILNLGAKSPVDGGCEFFYSNSPIAIRLAGAIDFPESSYVEWPGLRQQQNPHPGKGETFVPMLRFSMLASLIAAALA